MLNKKRKAAAKVLYYSGVTTDIVIENKVFIMNDVSLLSWNNAFWGLVFSNCGNIKIRNCTFVWYTKLEAVQMRALSFTWGNSWLIDIQYCTFIWCAYAASFSTWTYNACKFKYNIALEANNIANTSMFNDARFVFFNGATFTTPAEIDYNRRQCVNGMGGDIFNTFSSSNIKMRYNRLIWYVDSTKINTTWNWWGTFVLWDNGGTDQDVHDNVVLNTSAFGAQTVGELTGWNLNFSNNKVLIEQKNSAIGTSQMAIQMQNCQTWFTFSWNSARGYKFSGEEQSIYYGTFYNTCWLYNPVTLAAQNIDNDPRLTPQRMLPNRIV